MSSQSIRDRAAARRALGYGLLTPALLRAYYTIVNGASDRLPSVKAPTLVVHSRADNRTPLAAAQRAFERLGSKEKRLEFVEGGAHVITVDFGYERVFQLTRDWLDSHRA